MNCLIRKNMPCFNAGVRSAYMSCYRVTGTFNARRFSGAIANARHDHTEPYCRGRLDGESPNLLGPKFRFGSGHDLSRCRLRRSAGRRCESADRNSDRPGRRLGVGRISRRGRSSSGRHHDQRGHRNRTGHFAGGGSEQIYRAWGAPTSGCRPFRTTLGHRRENRPDLAWVRSTT
jgi:hypothetical protein